MQGHRNYMLSVVSFAAGQANDLGRTKFLNTLLGERLMMDVADTFTGNIDDDLHEDTDAAAASTSGVERQESAYLENTRL